MSQAVPLQWLVLLLMMPACVGGDAPPERPSVPSCGKRALLAVAGDNPFAANLIRVSACDGSEQRVTSRSRFSTIDASPSGKQVVFAAAPRTVDQVFRLVGTEVEPLVAGSAAAGFAPVVNDAGTTAFVALSEDMAQPFVVRLVDAAKSRVILRSAMPLGPVLIDEDNTVIVVRSPAEGLAASDEPVLLAALEPDGTYQELVLPPGAVTGLAWAAERSVMVSVDGRVIHVELASGVVRTVLNEGRWQVADSREGELLLLRDGELAIVRLASDFSAAAPPTPIPRLQAGPVIAAAFM